MLLVFYAVVLVAIVLLGANTQKYILLNHTRTQLIMSFVSGIMLGIAVFHLLPHALYAAEGEASIDYVALWLMIGLLAMFLLQRVFHFHQHDFDEADESATPDCGHHEPEHERDHSITELGGWGVFLGLALHSMLDGVALAASMQVDWQAAGSSAAAGLAGLGVFMAIFLHKPLDAMTIGMFLQRRKVGSMARTMVLIG
ncbi:MAG: iron permease, partial [Pseudomonadales bacterium]|nr:iron permease [Pseudomonadales bacterium]